MNERDIGRPMSPLRTYDRSWSEIEEMLEEANLKEMRFHKLKDGVFLLDL